MRGTFRTLAVAAAGALGVAIGGSATALTVSDMLAPITEFEDNDAESFGVDGGTAGKLEVGDTLRGILKIQAIDNLATVADPDFNIATGGPELTGVFEIKVLTKTFVSGDTNGNGVQDVGEIFKFDFTFGPTGTFDNFIEGTAGGLPDISDAAMVALWEDTVQEFVRSGCTTGAGGTCEGNIIDGILRVVLGLEAGEGNFWTALAAPDDLVLLETLSSTLVFGTFNYGLDVLYQALGLTLVDRAGLPDCLGSGAVHGNRDILGSPVTAYSAVTDTDTTCTFVPEPTSLTLLGSGLAAAGMIWGLVPMMRRRLAA